MVGRIAVLTHWSVRQRSRGPTSSSQFAVTFTGLDQRIAELPGLDTGGIRGGRD